MNDDIEAAVKQVVDAWLVEGKCPKYHRMWQRRLRKEWPVLARAIERLVRENEKR